MQTIATIPTWYLPTFHGDIRLEAETETSCRVIIERITPKERDAIGKLDLLSKKSLWRDTAINLDGNSVLRAPIGKVAKVLAKLLKPDRTIISAVKFSDGTMEEIREATTPATTELSEAKAKPAKPKPKKTPKTATSVAVPVRGCPPPDFSQAEIRAQRVLAEFITAEQISDFRRYQRFVSVGHVTGHRYMITSRHARDQLATYLRSLYDLDLQSPICAHDWEIPAAEELLGFHVLLQLPEWENYLAAVRDDNYQELLEDLGAH